MFNFFKKGETPQFRIEDNRSKASLLVFRGDEILGHIIYDDEERIWMFTPYSGLKRFYVGDFIRISWKLEELNDEN